MYLLVAILVVVVCPALSAQTNSLPSDVIAANQELDRQLLECHRLLDTDKIMLLFSKSADTFFIAPDGTVYKGRDRVRQSWETFFASLQSIQGNIDEISYMPAGDGVIAVGQVTYHRQLKNGLPEQRTVVWTDFRHKEDGKWVYVFRHAHWPAKQSRQRTQGRC